MAGAFWSRRLKELDMSVFWERMVRAAKLDVNLYEEVEADKQTLGQAMGVVVLASLAAGIGAGMRAGMGGFVLQTAAALLGWYVWAFITYWIGTRLLPEPQTKADVGELLRTTGFSSAPGLLRVLGVIPGLRGVVFFVASIWMIVAMVVAVRQALDYKSTGRAIGVCAIGFVIQLVVFGLVMSLFGSLARPM
jgi:hypothetical protein